MSELMDKILRGKEESRKRLAALSFEEKIALVEKMRDRDLLIAASPLRKQQGKPPVTGSSSDKNGKF
jgi:hypothetical protein